MRDQRVIRGKITIRSVDELRPGETLKSTEIPFFQVRAGATAKTYSLAGYRLGNGRGARQGRFTIGRHGSLTPAQATAKAKWALGEIASGRDPNADKHKQKSDTVADMARQFLEEIGAKRKPRTVDAYRQLLDGIVLPAIGKRPIAEVTRPDIARWHHAWRAAPVRANNALALATTLFNFAERIGLRPEHSNPCRHIDRYPQRQRERFLSADELARLGASLADYDGSPFVVAAIRLLVFTGARLGEILGLQWAWIDFERGEARLPDSKTGPKTLHFAPPALAVLSDLPRIAGNPYVIAGAKPAAALSGIQKPWREIRRAAGLDGLRLHDLRHAFASIAAASGMGLPIIGKMLGHSQAHTTHRYAHIASDPVKAAVTAVAGKIAAAMGGAANDADKPTEVVGLSDRRRAP